MNNPLYITIVVVLLFHTALAQAAGDKVTICHVPPGNPENVQILDVGAASAQKHIERHGDYLLADAVEFCDGKDNDCDREIDEDFLELGVACADGVGVCRQQGVKICSPDGTGTVCDAVPLDPPVTTESDLCDDGMDNDCDGATDCGDSDCSFDPACKVPVCGDGFVDVHETCDDGNTTDGDCCAANCQLDSLGTPCGINTECAQNQCNGSNTACEPIDTDSFACTGNGVDACSAADTCLSGACQDNGPNAAPEVCDNGIDDNCADGADCDDPTCAGEPICDEAPNLSCGDTEAGAVPEGVEFFSGNTGTLVSSAVASVDEAWLDGVPITCPVGPGDGTLGEVSLDIEITGLNGGFEFHGQQLVPMSETTLFEAEGGKAVVIIDWTADSTPRQVNETYTVCIQVVFPSGPVGDTKCQDFGPF